MQVAQALAISAHEDAEALRYLDIALSLGWPVDERDVRDLRARIAGRSGSRADAVARQITALPGVIRELAEPTLVPLLYDGLNASARRVIALQALDRIDVKLRAAGAATFGSTMFLMHWYAMLGDLDRAYAASERWVQLTVRSGSAGIPHNMGFWIAEMRPFRADQRFAPLCAALEMDEYWRRFGPPDGGVPASRPPSR